MLLAANAVFLVVSRLRLFKLAQFLSLAASMPFGVQVMLVLVARTHGPSLLGKMSPLFASFSCCSYCGECVCLSAGCPLVATRLSSIALRCFVLVTS